MHEVVANLFNFYLPSQSLIGWLCWNEIHLEAIKQNAFFFKEKTNKPKPKKLVSNEFVKLASL